MPEPSEPAMESTNVRMYYIFMNNIDNMLYMSRMYIFMFVSYFDARKYRQQFSQSKGVNFLYPFQPV